ncbi:MAG: hypothetical protein ACJ76F_02370 [Bacteroidia bacterium]
MSPYSKTSLRDSEKSHEPGDHPDISIWLDTYDDIFSDFDPRPLSDRNISDDFLYEVKKVASESDSFISELKLLLPEKNRDQKTESIITKRLHTFFLKKQAHYLNKRKEERRLNLLFVAAGTVLMTCAGLFSSRQSGNWLMHVLLVIVEPAGWFLVWTGMENLINTSRRERSEINFYSKLSHSRITFFNI